MAIVVPFKGVLYNRNRVEDLGSVTAPPYDVISPEEQERYYQQSPYNVIRLILGKQYPVDSDTDNRYTRAAGFFKQWQEESVLKRDPLPCLYFYHQEFLSGKGNRSARDGFIALVRLEEKEKGVIIPHEKTLDQPKEDRLKLMKACSANLSPVFSLYADPGDTSNLMRSGLLEEGSPLEVTDHEQTLHQLWRLSNPGIIEEVCRRLSGQPLFIADGHHRYETALNYRRWQLSRDPHIAGHASCNYVMMYLTALEGPGLLILPYHRVIQKIGFDFNGFEQKLTDYFDVARCALNHEDPTTAWTAFINRLQDEGRKRPAFGMYGFQQNCYHVLTLKEAVLSSLKDDDTGSAALKRLDVNIIETFIFKNVLGITSRDLQMQQNISYVHDSAQGLELVRTKGYQVAFFLNPTKAAEIQSIAGRGETMPQKSTFFYPKLLSGLVMNQIVPGELIEPS